MRLSRAVVMCMVVLVALVSQCFGATDTTNTTAPDTTIAPTTTIAPDTTIAPTNATTTTAPNTTVPETTTVSPAPTPTGTEAPAPEDLPYSENQKFGISCATFTCLAVAWALFCFVYGKVADRCSPEAEGPKYAQVPQANKL